MQEPTRTLEPLLAQDHPTTELIAGEEDMEESTPAGETSITELLLMREVAAGETFTITKMESAHLLLAVVGVMFIKSNLSIKSLSLLNLQEVGAMFTTSILLSIEIVPKKGLTHQVEIRRQTMMLSVTWVRRCMKEI